MPAGSSRADSSGAKRPSTKTSSQAPARRWRASEGASAGLRAPPAGRAGRTKRVRATGATLVKRHSSSRVVGKPSARKRSAASARKARSGPERVVATASSSSAAKGAVASSVSGIARAPAQAVAGAGSTSSQA